MQAPFTEPVLAEGTITNSQTNPCLAKPLLPRAKPLLDFLFLLLPSQSASGVGGDDTTDSAAR